MTAKPQENTPEIWRHLLPRPGPADHKYTRGHLVIFASATFTGATRLAAEAASRIGAGMVTVLAEEKADLFRAVLPPDIVVTESPISSLNRVSGVLAGPGGLTDDQARQLNTVDEKLPLILDADALRLVVDGSMINRDAVLTPHEGEFARYFGSIEDRRTAIARVIARYPHTIVLKGQETLISGPDRADLTVNSHATPFLAKAGTGDVLAGLIAGLRVQGMSSISAAQAGVWIQSELGRRVGPGLVPQDLFGQIGPILSDLFSQS